MSLLDEASKLKSDGNKLKNEINDLSESFFLMQKAVSQDPYPSIKTRQTHLRVLKQLLQDYANEFVKTISEDFSYRASYETLMMEIFPAINAINYCLKHIRQWSKDQKRSVSWLFKPAYAYLSPQPLGVVGIIVPWNYPLFLAIEPLAYALSAGNKVMIKCSELTPRTGHLLERLIQNSVLKGPVEVINGGVEVSKAFSSLAFNHLFFTGSTGVGKQIMATAAENLTPITLELGGKSPAIISNTMKSGYLKRLFLGKIVNAGQTCVAPDYLFIPEGWQEKITEAAEKFISTHYPNLPSNLDYSSIISSQHKKRLLELLKDAEEKGGRLVQVGDETEENKMPFFLVFNVKSNMRVMQEEIFGPILPVLTFTQFNQVIDQINKLPRPLVIYYFGEEAEEKSCLKTETCSGALSINDTLTHVAIDDLPFGGVGQSGMGEYHGREGFNTFSQLKPIFVQRRFAPVTWFYPPFGGVIRSFLSLIVGIKHLKGKHIDGR